MIKNTTMYVSANEANMYVRCKQKRLKKTAATTTNGHTLPTVHIQNSLFFSSKHRSAQKKEKNWSQRGILFSHPHAHTHTHTTTRSPPTQTHTHTHTHTYVRCFFFVRSRSPPTSGTPGWEYLLRQSWRARARQDAQQKLLGVLSEFLLREGTAQVRAAAAAAAAGVDQGGGG